MAAKTFLIKNAIASGSSHGSLQDGGSLTTATTGTGWIVGTTAGLVYANETYGSKLTAASFGATAQPSSNPITNDCWRSESTLSGYFSAGAWTIAISIISVSAGATGTGKLRFKLWKGSAADGSNAVEITSGAIVTTGWSNLTTATAQNLTGTFNLASVAPFSNEYLFMQVGCQIDTASNNTASDVLFRVDSTNSKITTSDFKFGLAGFISDGTVNNWKASSSYGPPLPNLSSSFSKNGILDVGTINSWGASVSIGLALPSIFLGKIGNLDSGTTNLYKSSNTKGAPTIVSGKSGNARTLGTVTYYYIMRGIDPNCSSLTYRTWIVSGSPDITGSQYKGDKCGASPLTSIHVIGSYTIVG